MPLVRFELKNEYGLGDSRLYKGGRKEEDPRNILGGFTVSGLVGILRQLGDLAEFAAVVFHNVHQQVITTAERGQKVLNRIQKIEGALPQFEKAVQEQKSHIHFAYIKGCDWHANIQAGPSELFASDLPEFMMDSYERCRDPPRLDLLDKFDSAGSGACLKRYSDPTYLRRVMAGSESVIAGGARNGVNIQKKKKQKTRMRNGLARHSVHMTLHGTRNAQFAPVMTEKLRISIDDASISDTLLNSGSRNELTLFSSDKRSGCLQPHNTPLSLSKELYDDDLSAIEEENKKNVDCSFDDYSRVSASDYVIEDLMHLQYPLLSTSVSSDEKTEMVKTVTQMIPSVIIPEDGLNNGKAAEYCSALSNKSRETDGLRMQMNLLSESSIWDETATETRGKSDSSANSATYDENGTTDSTSPTSPDDVSAFRSSDLTVDQISELTSRLYMDMNETNALGSKVQTNVQCETGQEVILLPHLNYDVIKSVVSMSLENSNQPTPSLDGVVGDSSPFSSQDSDILLTHESSIHSDMIHTEMRNEEIDLSNTMVEISELTSQLDKHMDATNALDSKVKTKLEYQIRHGVILLPHQDYYGIESEVSKIVGADSRSKDDVGSGICPFEPQDDSDLLFLTLEPSNRHYEITGTEMPNQEDYLTLKTLPSLAGREIRELTSQSEKHLNVSNAFVSEVQTDVEYQNGGAILLTNKKYDGMECDINKSPGIATTSIDDVDGEISYDSITPLNKELSPTDFDHMQPACSAEFAHLHCSVDNAVRKSSGSFVENESETIGNVIPCEKINGIPQEISSSQDSFGDTSAKTASQKEILYEHETKLEVESAADSDCRLIEYQISMENVIATSKFIGPDIDSNGVCCSSSDDYASSILSDTITSNTPDISNSSILTDDATSSRCPNLASSPRNVSEYSNGNMSTALTDTSIILSSNVSAARTVAFQGFPVESLRKSSTNIWTNGGLLGLEPSKPSDISVPNAYCSDKIYNDRSSADSQPCVSGNRNESRTSSFQANKLNHAVSSPEKDKFAGSNNEPESNLSKLNDDENKVEFSGPAHRSPVNNLHRKSSIAGISPLCELMNKDVYNLDGTSILSKHNQSPRVHELENEDVDDDGHGFSEKLVSSSLFHSSCQSPPVEHMKVSSQPMNNSVVSKLRLEFCDINLEKNMGEVMFPSFQLISESFHPLESDDDTFCRSCPYSSDDLLALYSESDAETWGEDELDVSNRSEIIGSTPSSINGETNASR